MLAKGYYSTNLLLYLVDYWLCFSFMFRAKNDLAHPILSICEKKDNFHNITYIT